MRRWSSTRAIALVKAARWYDAISDGNVVNLAIAIGTADVSDQQRGDAIVLAREVAERGREPFLEKVEAVLDRLIGGRMCR